MDSKAHTLAEFAAVVAQETTGVNPYTIARAVLTLRRYATAHDRLCVEACNRTLTDREGRRQQTIERDAHAYARRVLGPGFGVVHQRDPRGATLRLTLPSGRTNSLHNDGWCIPTSKES